MVGTQKTDKSNGKLIPLREEMLNSIGFVWDAREYNWKLLFAALKSFKEKEGRWPRKRNVEDKREIILANGKPVLRDLAAWMQNQKADKRIGKMIPFREGKLNDIGFPFHKRKKAPHECIQTAAVPPARDGGLYHTIFEAKLLQMISTNSQ